MRSTLLIALLTIGVAVGCAAPGPTGSSGRVSESPSGAQPTPKHITVAVAFEPNIRPDAQGPAKVIQPLVQSGLTVLDGQNVRHPVLVETVPSLENGLWMILPDGRMETTWKIREGAQWHDGSPLRTDDLIFGLEVGQDKQMSIFNSPAYGSIENATAPDSRTLIVTWKELSIDVDALFEAPGVALLPKHLLEDAYRTDKTSLLDLPYWTQDYVGTGPYQVRQWAPGIGVTLDARTQYVLGRPKIDSIDVRYIPDDTTVTANLLAGTVDVTNSVGSIDSALQLRDQWRDGHVAFSFGSSSWIAMNPQFVDPRPAILSDVRFRRALLHAIDRQELADTLAGGMSPVAHSFLNPNQPQYQEIEAALPRYEYDTRTAVGLMQEMGNAKGGDGMYRDAAGQTLQIDVRSGPQDQAAKPATAIAGYWQQLGVAATADRVNPQRLQDLEYLATFPAFFVRAGTNDIGGLRYFQSSASALPSNNFRVPGNGNRSRYMNAPLDALLDTYFKTLPIAERTRVLGSIIHQVADQVATVGLYYNPSPGAFSNRVLNVSQQWPSSFITWNAYEWDVTL